MDYYNYIRTHQGYKLKENGYDTPAEAHLSKSLKKDLPGEIISDKVSPIMSDKKEVGEKTILEDNFIKTRSEEEEVLACQFVTTS